MDSNIPKKWLITGGCGFIGLNLIEELVNNYECNIRIIDNLNKGDIESLGKICNFEIIEKADHPFQEKVQLYIRDIKNRDVAYTILNDIDCIVHLAANTGVQPSIDNPLEDCNNNIIGTINYLEAARQNNVSKFIFASSGASLGEQTPPLHEEKIPKPIAPYGASKLSVEAYCLAYYGSFGMNTTILRFGNVYGPWSMEKESVVAKFIKQVLRNELITIYGNGKQTRDFIYVKDIIGAIIKSSKYKVCGEMFQLANGEEISTNELTNIMKDIISENTNKEIKIKYAPARKGEIIKNFTNISKARKYLNWSPSTNIKKGIDETLQWFLENQV